MNFETNSCHLFATSCTQTCTKLTDVQNNDITESSDNNSYNVGDSDNDFNEIFDDES